MRNVQNKILEEFPKLIVVFANGIFTKLKKTNQLQYFKQIF